MRKWWTLLLFTLVLLPTMATAHAQELDIRTTAQSVVLIDAIAGNQILGSGSGTIIDPNGRIYTNAHVIEGGTDFAILLLSDIRELPEFRYFARLEWVSPDIDFAILQIDRDANGRSIDPSTLNLPFIRPASEELFVGDEIRVFGYPGIGDGYMVVTSGEVVTVQNGDMYGQRIPVWYRTDAEISGGNSGGLVVNERGEMVGMPTWVRSEERTGGRLGGVLPIPAMNAALVALEQGISGNNNAAPGGTSGTTTLTLTNNSDTPICYVFISPTTSRTWGDDQLGQTEVIAAGTQRAFDVQIDFYDMLLEDCDRNTLDDIRNIDVSQPTMIAYPSSATAPGGSSGESVLPDGPADSTFTVENLSGMVICYVNISPTTADVWGEDQLGSTEVIDVGGLRNWEVPSGTYDIRLLDCDQNTLDEIYGVEVFGKAVIQFQ